MTDWQPIATYDALKKKPERAVFYFKADKPANPRDTFYLRATIQTERNYGRRVCTYWIELPPPPMEVE